MSRVLEGLKPERVFYYFEEISNIPRCSGQEEKISNYLAGLGRKLGLETIQDEALNVIIKKPATPGYENSPTVILQGHMDMVCEKEEACNHDFSKDPLKLKVEGDFITADGTTLGADNGIAVAMCLALLEAKDVPHPPLEVLLTTDEEVGMGGAKGLNPNNLTGKILINIDSEEEGTALVSCAGGEDNLVTIPIQWQKGKATEAYYIKTAGLLGGHSGMEIDKGRGNANRIIARVLSYAKDKCNIELAHIEGGSKANAIPRNGSALVLVNKEEEDAFLKAVDNIKEAIQKELAASEPAFSLVVEKAEEKVEKVFTEDSFNRVMAALMLIPTGVQSMSMEMDELVESSCNMAIVNTEADQVTIRVSLRSSKESLKKFIAQQIETVAKLVKGAYKRNSSYPAWEYKEDSYIRGVFKKVYKEQFGKELEIKAIHAGLECGIFDEKFNGNLDMISFGPNMYGVHTPQEKLSISSVERTYQFLLAVLKEIK